MNAEKHFLLQASSLEEAYRLIRTVKSRFQVAYAKAFILSTGVWIFLKLEKPEEVELVAETVKPARLKPSRHGVFERDAA